MLTDNVAFKNVVPHYLNLDPLTKINGRLDLCCDWSFPKY